MERASAIRIRFDLNEVNQEVTDASWLMRALVTLITPVSHRYKNSDHLAMGESKYFLVRSSVFGQADRVYIVDKPLSKGALL